MLILVVVALALLIVYVGQLGTDVRAAAVLEAGAPWYRVPILRGLVAFFALLLLPPTVVAFGPWGRSLAAADGLLPFSVLLAALISYTWYRFLTWLDVFEPEKRWSLTLVFGVSCAAMWFVPMLSMGMERLTGLRINGEFGNDLTYSVVVIGHVEEVTKLVPYLIILLFTRQINEPYDHLLYICLSALGFAFIENIQYLHESRLSAVAGRALFASVAHMCFSSMIGYAIARSIGRSTVRIVLAALLGLLLASLSHGLYDVWLIAPGRPTFLTTVFFLGTIQLWVIMKNNLVNLSPFAEPHRKLRSTMFRYRIINAMLGIFMLAFVAVYLMGGPGYAWSLMRTQGLTMLVMLLILALSFGSYQMVPGYVAAVRVSANPIRWFLPISRLGSDLSGSRIRIDIPARTWSRIKLPALRRALPVMGILERRVVVDGDADWYLFRPERQLDLGSGFEPLFLMKLDADLDTIPTANYVRMLLRRFDGPARIVQGEVVGGTEPFVPRFFAQLIPPIIPGAAEGGGLSAIGGHGLS